jgi:hypothetical protein
MSEWLERELRRGLAPVRAPEALGIRLGFAAGKRWALPRVALGVAAAVVMAIGGGYQGGRTVLEARRGSSTGALLRTVEGARLTETGLPRCDGGAGMPVRVDADRAIVLLAHSGGNRPAHALAAGDCNHCHRL